VHRRRGLAGHLSVIVVLVSTLGMSAVAAGPAFGSDGPPSATVHPRRSTRASAATTSTTTPHRKQKRKKKTAPTTTRGSAASAKALLDAYCASVASGEHADATLFDDAMRPLLTRGVTDSALHTSDPSLASDATALLNTVTASLSAPSLAQVPVDIRSDVQVVRAEKQAILHNLVNAANGDASGIQFLVQATNTAGGVQQQFVSIATFLQANCPASDRPPTPT
jgi:hypothetical protein